MLQISYDHLDPSAAHPSLSTRVCRTARQHRSISLPAPPFRNPSRWLHTATPKISYPTSFRLRRAVLIDPQLHGDFLLKVITTTWWRVRRTKVEQHGESVILEIVHDENGTPPFSACSWPCQNVTDGISGRYGLFIAPDFLSIADGLHNQHPELNGS